MCERGRERVSEGVRMDSPLEASTGSETRERLPDVARVDGPPEPLALGDRAEEGLATVEAHLLAPADPPFDVGLGGGVEGDGACSIAFPVPDPDRAVVQVQ